jgi:hypothetical protein
LAAQLILQQHLDTLWVKRLWILMIKKHRSKMLALWVTNRPALFKTDWMKAYVIHT